MCVCVCVCVCLFSLKKLHILEVDLHGRRPPIVKRGQATFGPGVGSLGQCRRAETLMPRVDGDHDVDKVTPMQPRPAVDSEISCPCQCLTGNSAADKPAVTGMVSCSHLNLLTG